MRSVVIKWQKYFIDCLTPTLVTYVTKVCLFRCSIILAGQQEKLADLTVSEAEGRGGEHVSDVASLILIIDTCMK